LQFDKAIATLNNKEWTMTKTTASSLTPLQVIAHRIAFSSDSEHQHGGHTSKRPTDKLEASFTNFSLTI